MKIHRQTYLKGRIKRDKKRLLRLPESSERRLLERELLSLLSEVSNVIPRLEGERLILGEAVADLPTFSSENIDFAVRNTLGGVETDADISSLIWQTRLIIAERAIDGDMTEALSHLTELKNVSQDELIKRLDPLEKELSVDPLYLNLSKETRADYRAKVTVIGLATGVDSNRLGFEYAALFRREGKHIGEYILSDYRRVFPSARARRYALWLLAYSVARAVIVGLFTAPWVIPLAILPMIALSKPFADLILSHSTRSGGYLPRLRLDGKVPPFARTLCVMSVVLPSEAALSEGVERLLLAREKNPSENIGFCLLCDLMPSKKREEGSDTEIVKAAKKLSMNNDVIIIIRKRSYSKTQGRFQGRERKRGAIEDLMRYISTGESDFLYISKNAAEIRKTRYVCALDSDTMPLMNSISELVSIALHPHHSDIGIIVPRVTTCLSSSLKTLFSRIMSGNGGCSNVSSYDASGGELYQDFYDEGTFCGKGLIDVRQFCCKCVGEFPNEKILSHDILEGGRMGVAYAGDVEFSDSFPPTPGAYFKRLGRWLRGDFQNAPFVFSKRLTKLTRFKLLDNLRRGLSPIFSMSLVFASVFVPHGYGLLYIAVFSVFMPYLFALVPCLFRGGFGRKFYSPVLPEALRIIRLALMELLLLPKHALCSLDALCRTIWRKTVTKRHLLDWTTSELTRGGGVKHLIFPELLSIALLVLSLWQGAFLETAIAVFFCCLLPVLAFSDLRTNGEISYIPESLDSFIHNQVETMWRFYSDTVTEERHFVPPDNLQLSPVSRVAERTSPTNIGMYLLSIIAVRLFGIISEREAADRIAQTIATLERLKKYHGNLYNWYSLESGEPLNAFVSSVDSGNLLCCLVAVSEWLSENNNAALSERVKGLYKNADLSVFFDNNLCLFSVGLDADTEERAKNHYDLLMSESRMLSYFAIAMRQVPKAHWRALSREPGKLGQYFAPVSWTGTMFEFFMPELLLKSEEGSIGYESLRFALSSQEKEAEMKNIPYGKSESGYYGFDEQLNYQYRAHGTAAAALKAGQERETVISPYSSFLALALDPLGAQKNLERLRKYGAENPEKYGYYEAVDFTESRVGSGSAVVKSYMAHHIGMSICAAANCVRNDELRRLFMKCPEMRGADELLEEKIPTGQKVLSPPQKLGEIGADPASREKLREFSVLSPRVWALSGGGVTALCTDYGEVLTIFGGKYLCSHSRDLLREPRGNLFAATDGDEILPFYSHPSLSSAGEYSVDFGENSSVYLRKTRELDASMTVFALSDSPALCQKMRLRNKTALTRKVGVIAYLEPVLSALRDYRAHPAYMDLFLKAEYDPENRIVTLWRKERDSDKIMAAAVGFFGGTPEIRLNRENVIARNGGIFSALFAPEAAPNALSPVPCPCVYGKIELSAEPHKCAEMLIVTAFADSAEKAKRLCLKIGQNAPAPYPDGEIISPLVKNTEYGRVIGRLLPKIIADLPYSEKRLSAITENTLDKTALYRLGLSGDKPIILFSFPESEKDAGGIDALLAAKKALSLTGLDTEIAVICKSEREKRLLAGLCVELGVKAATVSPEEGELITLLRAVAVSSVEGHFSATRTTFKQPEIKEIRRVIPETAEGGFHRDSYVITQKPLRPWSNVAANSQFGTLMSDCALGFSWALNSRENKLSVWRNDLRRDNDGELLLLRVDGHIYNAVDGATVLISPNSAEYSGIAADISLKTTVRAFQKGMGKLTELSLENRSNSEKTLEIAYYIEPLMAADFDNSLPKATIRDGAIVVENPLNPSIKGKMVLFSDNAEYLTDRVSFLSGKWNGEGGSGCVVAVVKLILPPRKKEKLKFILAFTKNTENPITIIKALKKQTLSLPFSLPKNEVSGIYEVNALYRAFLPWQTVGMRLWARTGFYQNGGAFGFRDQLQDAMAAIPFAPALCEYQLFRAAGSQFMEGDVLHWWFDLPPIKKGVRTRCSDDLLWLPFVAAEYVRQTGNDGILSKKIAFIEGDLLGNADEKYIETVKSDEKASLYEHCKRALDRAFRMGKHGLLLIGTGDWNDGYNNVGKEGRGESVWLSMFYAMIARRFAVLSETEKDFLFAEKLRERERNLFDALDRCAWDGEYYLRAYYDNGEKMGSADSDRCKIDLLPQAFAALSEMPDRLRVQTALSSAVKRLFSDGIVRLFTPAFSSGKDGPDPGYVSAYPEGVRENGGQYTHAAVWLALACLKSDMREDAERLIMSLMPFGRGEGYGNEPYFLSADVYTNQGAFGRGGWSGYTGAAGWLFTLLSEYGENTEK